MKQLIAYYSRAGQNLVNGCVRELQVGNTEILAGILQKLTGGACLRIVPVEDYPKDYYHCINEARRDLITGKLPELQNLPESLDAYEVIYLGFPNYWGTIPMPVASFLKQYDFDRKRIRPFCTHEGGGLGRSLADIQALCPGGVVEPGMALRGSEISRNLKQIEVWVREREGNFSEAGFRHSYKMKGSK